MEILDVISRITHVGTAIVLIGGSAFTALVLMPAASQIPDESHQALRAAVADRWKRFVHAGILLFLISGFYNYIRAIEDHRGDGIYHALIGTKMLLAFVVMFLAAALVGRSAALQKLRQQRGRTLTIMLTLAAVVVAIGGYAKVRGVPVGVPQEITVDAEESNESDR
ncbi:hypothetical protein [Crateriforma spongiae]|uniref:hypothetical protein n=1 Tax=Crateriforma spongiae TaxID=2724528 RepID=UPI001445B2E1|nr:hypothetical protein [Crateriforma spongiae]